jgi:hypothetical protein
MPLPKSQNQRQLRKGQVDLVDLAEPAFLDEVVRFLKLRHAALLGANLDNAFILVLSLDDRLALGEVVRQGLLDVDILLRIAGVHGHGHVPVVGAADEDGIDILVVEDFLVIPSRDGLRVGDLLGLIQMGIVNVAHGSHADIGNLGQRAHQVLAAAARADAADVERLIGAESIDSRNAECRDAGRDTGGRLQHGTAGDVRRVAHGVVPCLLGDRHGVYSREL